MLHKEPFVISFNWDYSYIRTWYALDGPSCLYFCGNRS